VNTDQLIAALVEDIKPVRRHAVGRRLAIGIGRRRPSARWWSSRSGWGFNPQLDVAMRHYHFWMKWGYTLSLGLCAVGATARLARPDSGRMGWLWVMALPVASLAALGIFEMSRVPPRPVVRDVAGGELERVLLDRLPPLVADLRRATLVVPPPRAHTASRGGRRDRGANRREHGPQRSTASIARKSPPSSY
jgi:hypothetical protein